MNKVKANEVLKAIPTNNVTLLDKEVQFWVNKEYGISDLKDFTAENIAKKIMEYENKFLHTHTLKVWKICKWQNIARIYFIKEQHE